MSLAVQTTYNDRIKAGIDIVGISNFVTFLKNTQGYRRDLRRAEYGDERDPEMRAYPRAKSRRCRSAEQDPHADPGRPGSERPARAALRVGTDGRRRRRRTSVPVWYVVGKNEGHGFAKKANQDYLQAVEVEFLRRYLLGTAP